jgi:hypothetical protein
MVPAFTTSLWVDAVSLCGLDGGGARIVDMDVVAILIGVAMFALLYALIYGIDRI